MSKPLPQRFADRLQLLRADLPRPYTHVSLQSDMVLISQVARSGGTLLNQLLDHHTQLLVHPFELEMGATRSVWPDLQPSDLANSEDVMRALYESSVDRFIMEGLSPHRPGSRNETRYPFRFSRSVYRRAFAEEWRRRAPTTQRVALDVQLSAFWSAWRDRPTIVHDVRWLVGFRPGTIKDLASMERFQRDYPRGRIISLVREPSTWFVSARRHSSRYGEASRACDVWNANVSAAIRLKELRPTEVFIGSFERLVGNPAEFMAGLTTWLGVQWEDTLLSPTMAGRPMKADSSFEIGEFGIRPETADRREDLTRSERTLIEERCGATLDRARRLMG
jgi:hypothetical protein